MAVPVCQLLSLQSRWQATAVNCSHQTLQRFADFVLAGSLARCQQGRFLQSLDQRLQQTIAESGMRFPNTMGLSSARVSEFQSEPFQRLLFVPQHVMRHERISFGQHLRRKRKLVELDNYLRSNSDACRGRVIQRKLKRMKVSLSGPQLATGGFFTMSVEQGSPRKSILGSSYCFLKSSVQSEAADAIPKLTKLTGHRRSPADDVYEMVDEVDEMLETGPKYFNSLRTLQRNAPRLLMHFEDILKKSPANLTSSHG
mmetsp:Transcript_20470/g.29709  ORF Transcript_20470/g.29709 Transcript_20470/m.29709 type:complete len:256 (-) Transcript_20470:153-920(-)